MSSQFSPISIDSLGTLHLALSWNALRCCFYEGGKSFHIQHMSYHENLPVCFLIRRILRRIFAETIL